MRNRSTVYLGLFLIALGLYASQLKKKSSPVRTAVTTEISAETPEPARPQARIQLLYEKISSEGMFSNKISGIQLKPAHPPVVNEFFVTLSGDEMFAGDGVSIAENWSSTLDTLANLIKPERGLKVEISGFADEADPKEKKPTDYGSSALSFSYARAEWLAHYFERRHGIPVQKTFVLRGMGPVQQGKKVTLRFEYHSAD